MSNTTITRSEVQYDEEGGYSYIEFRVCDSCGSSAGHSVHGGAEHHSEHCINCGNGDSWVR